MGVLVLLAIIVIVPELQYPALPSADVALQQAQGQLRNNARSILLQAVAGLLVVLGATATWYQVRVNRDGQITDRYSRAIEHLGSDNVDVRIGGLYVLERIANNSAEDRRFIQLTIGSFLRNQSPWPVGSPDGPEHPTPAVDRALPWLRIRASDVQTALAVLSRQPKAREAPPVNLSRVDLRSAYLENGDLSQAEIRWSNLARARLRGTRLDGCDLHRTDLRLADLERVSLREASLRNAYLEGADLRGADLTDADLRGADMRALHLDEAVLDGARVDGKTIWPTGFARFGVSASLFSD
ncbi:pentapeptide repeat-containing protein [Lentzea kentuckyensis]|uniref:pentapeptide repeat-containing protein n=1 Tax=Lentzea kentuckyensis TaxID=360086 RepID=UPI0013024948|nr:pentapeptide repeat-containing protein [Lentzea kentuckyensis]